jgi:hypothetical protein
MASSSEQSTSPPRWRARASLGVVAAVATVLAPSVGAAWAPEPPAPPSTDAVEPPPLSMVLEQVVDGDLVMVGGTAQPGPDGTARDVDVDGEVGTMCIDRTTRRGAVCDDNSSSAFLDLPAGAAVIAARLYVSSTLAASVGPLDVRLAGPGDEWGYTELAHQPEVAPRVAELSERGHRQAIWDVTEFVRRRGPGDYTVADIVSEPIAGAEHSAWTIVVVYQLANDVDLTQLPPEQQLRFARRAISWHDGLATTAEGPVEVEVGGFTLPMDRPVFAKSAHVVASSAGPGFDNVLFAGGPLGNNATPGDAAPPPGVVIGTDPLCNSTVDIVNGTICTLGTPAGASPVEPVSAVDMDVVRVPDRYLLPGATSAVVSVAADADVAVSVLAVSIDQPAEGAP